MEPLLDYLTLSNPVLWQYSSKVSCIIFYAFDSWDQLQELVRNNLLGGYGRDCESRDTNVSFMTVFGVLFSGVRKINPKTPNYIGNNKFCFRLLV